MNGGFFSTLLGFQRFKVRSAQRSERLEPLNESNRKIFFMASLPKISIVVPTRNRRRLLEETVRSIFAQSFSNWELIIVDDVSEDSTWSWLQGLSNPRVTKIRLEERHEQCGSRNVGLRAAQGEFFISLDDDDLLPERALETHVSVLEQYPDIIASVGGWITFDESRSRKANRIIRRRTLRPIWKDVLFGWVPVSGQCMFRTETLRSICGWDESFIRATDHELWSRLGRLGQVVLSPDIVLLYRVHSGQWRPRNLNEIMIEARAQTIRKLNGIEREEGERFLRAGILARTAWRHYGHAEAFQAFKLYCKILRMAPEVLRSPVCRPMVLKPMLGCLAGGLGLRVGRKLQSSINRMLKREIKVTADVNVDSDGRLHALSKGNTNASSSSANGVEPVN